MDDVAETKVPYVPSERKRWEISKDPYSRERVRKLHDTYKFMREALTYKDAQSGEEKSVDIGVVLEGSLSKGKVLTDKTQRSADIDFITFYDLDELICHKDDILREHPFGVFAVKYHETLDDLISDPIIKTEMDRTGDLGVYAQLVVSEAIRAQFAEAVDKNLPDPEKIVFRVIPLAENGDESIFGSVMEKYKSSGNKALAPGLVRDYDYLVSMYFHLDIGGGMKKFIRGFLRQIDEMSDEERDNVWSFVRNAVEKTERGGEIPNEIRRQFPQTFFDACEFYRVFKK